MGCVVSTYLYGAFECMLLSCQVRVSEWIYILQLPECQGTPCPRDRRDIWSLSGSNGIRTHNHLVCKRTRNHLVKLVNDLAVLWVLICTVHLGVCYYHVTYGFQSKSTLNSCLYVKELLAQNRHDMISGSNGIRTHCADKYSQHSSIIWSV